MKFMKIYEILDEEIGKSIGVLLYYEKQSAFIIELQDSLDEWEAPLLFAGLVRQQIYTIPSEISGMWVKERVIPCGRQNIGSILSRHKLKTYDEMKFLEISEGKCSQDHLFIRKMNALPNYVKERMRKNLKECLVLEDENLLCFFMDDTTNKLNLSDLSGIAGVDKLKKNKSLLLSGKVGVGGYSINFGEAIDIPATALYNAGQKLPLSLNDFICFVDRNILDTSQCCSLLNCSRQNLAYLQGKGLTPVKENVKGNLFLKGDIYFYL